MSKPCFVCGEDAASVPVDDGWERHIHEQCKHLYPLAKEYADVYEYQRDDYDDAVLYGMEKAAALLGTPLNVGAITASRNAENRAWNKWRKEQRHA